MYSIYIGAGAGVVLGLLIWLSTDCKSFWWKTLGSGGVGTVLGLFGGLILSGLVPTHDVDYGPGILVSMRSSDGVTGAMIWGTGSIESQNYLHFMQKVEDGSMVPGSIPADSNVHIVEDPKLKDSGTWVTTMREPNTASPLWKFQIGPVIQTVERQEFHVPVGTVVQQFKVQ